MLREPNAPFARPGTGRTKARSHKRRGSDCVQSCSISAASRLMRAIAGSGGLTYPSSTFNTRLPNVPAVMLSLVVAVEVYPADVASNDTSYEPGAVSTSMPRSACQRVASKRNVARSRSNARARMASTGCGVVAVNTTTSPCRIERALVASWIASSANVPVPSHVIATVRRIAPLTV